MRLSRMTKIVGRPKGLYLAFFKKIKKNPFPIFVPIFGEIKKYNEILNIESNFVMDALRDETVEGYIDKKKNPCIIDCGVNVGITIRWWFHLNSNAKVYGIDMLKEAQEFTSGVLGENLKKNKQSKKYDFVPIVCALYNKVGVEFKINTSDPLHGNNNIFDNEKATKNRVVVSKTLDSVFKTKGVEEVALLKVDLEGAGGYALEGGLELLKKTKHIVFETHNEAECKLAAKILSSTGFLLRKLSGPQMWWENSKI